MSQEQPQRQGDRPQEPIKYGDVFDVSAELAEKLIAPQDAAMMQTAEARVFGQTQKGGPAAAMQAAATINESAGLVGHGDVTDVTGDKGVTVTATNYPGTKIITESVAGQVVGQYYEVIPVQQGIPAPVQAQVTIGEALEATVHTAGDKPVNRSDAEARATGSSIMAPGGVAATAQSAASFNAGLDRDEDKIKMSDVLTGAGTKLAADKVATKEDAGGVVRAELRNNPTLTTYPGGVGASVVAAARLNEGSA